MPVTVSAMFIPVNDVASDGFRWVTVGGPGQDVDIVRVGNLVRIAQA